MYLKYKHTGIAQIISTFLNRTQCNGYHTRKYKFTCRKHPNDYYCCVICKAASAYLTNIYLCINCQVTYCLHHIIDHNLLYMKCTRDGMGISCITNSIWVTQSFISRAPELIPQHLSNSNIVLYQHNSVTIQDYCVWVIKFMRAANITGIGKMLIQSLILILNWMKLEK